MPPFTRRGSGKGAGGGAHGKGKIFCVCQQAKCRLRASLAFFPLLLVECCCGCISFGISLLSELDRQKLTLGGKEDGVLPGHTSPLPPCPMRSVAARNSSPAWASVPSLWLHPLWGMGLPGENLVTLYCCVRISPHYNLILSVPQLFQRWSHNSFYSKLLGGHVSLWWALSPMIDS